MYSFRMGVSLLLGAIYMLVFAALFSNGTGFGAALIWASIIMAIVGFILAISASAGRDLKEKKTLRDGKPDDTTDTKE